MAGKQGGQKALRTSKRLFYTIDGGKLQRSRNFCPKCGPGVFLALHSDRASCGRCGYTEFSKK